MNLPRFFLLLLLGVSGLQACKKEGDYPESIRPSDFFVRCTLVDDQGHERPYEYRGEDTLTLFPGVVFDLGYRSNAYIQDSIRHIWGGLGDGLLPMPFFLQLSQPERVSDPLQSPEWRPEDFDNLIYPGKEFRYGPAPGEAVIGIADYPNGAWSLNTLGHDNAGSYLRVEEVSDYGIPELGTPYFGRKVRFRFECRLSNGDNGDWLLRDGEAVLFFRYYKY